MNKTVLIRNGIYETNSSSTHSLVLGEDSIKLDTSLIPDESGIVFLDTGQFGWEWNKYNDARTKANYLLTSIKDIKNKDSKEENTRRLENVIKKRTYCKDVLYKNSEGAIFPLLKGLIEEEDGRYRFSVFYDNGYIDHQSVGYGIEVLKEEKTIDNFIFNLTSWLFTGNDNDDIPKDFYNIDI